MWIISQNPPQKTQDTIGKSGMPETPDYKLRESRAHVWFVHHNIPSTNLAYAKHIAGNTWVNEWMNKWMEDK